ncbi:hypothetical protein RYO59_002289 [Thermosynechococcaceae cyanobacterium Okahandja]
MSYFTVAAAVAIAPDPLLSEKQNERGKPHRSASRWGCHSGWG